MTEKLFAVRSWVSSTAASATAPKRNTSGHELAEALRESEERYRMLLDGIQNYAIFMMDTRGRILSWNAGAERIKGYTADQIIGHNFSCFFPREDIKRGRPEEVLRIAAASGRHEEQSMRVRKDGSRFLAGVTFTALRDPVGNLQGFSEFSHDLSESKESEAKYRGLLEAAPDAMVVVNVAGDIVLLNVRAEKEFGYSRDELIGQKVKNIIPEGFAERIIADGRQGSNASFGAFLLTMASHASPTLSAAWRESLPAAPRCRPASGKKRRHLIRGYVFYCPRDREL